MSAGKISAERLEQARRVYRHCLLCEHRCGVDRTSGERGFCNATAEARVYRSRVECGEEIELIPSQLFYLSGCNLRCAFCIGEKDAFDPQRGRSLTGKFLTDAIGSGREQGARNIQWVGGEPTIHLPAILDAMAGCGSLPPVVWKSNFFGTTKGFGLLDGIVHVYVADFKFGNDVCARRIAGVDGYMRIVTRNLLLAAQGARLIIRHLLLPGHVECCYRPIVDWMRRNLPAVPLRIMAGYLPRWRAAGHEELASPLGREVGTKAVALAREMGLNVIL
ncbi:MAG: radical SAM protein [Pirellulales bacterium]|nr:radical SAM protein [Pirellulales bacterium]